MMYPCRLETETGHFVIATQVAFQTVPTALLWGERLFVLYEAGQNGYPHRYRERFWTAVVQESDVDPIPSKEPKDAA